MTAPPLDPTGADRRLRVVFVTVPDTPRARTIGAEAVRRKLAARAAAWPIRSSVAGGGARGRVADRAERAILLTTSAKKLGALLRHLAERIPDRAPPLLELHVPRVHEGFARWLLAAIDPGSAEPPAPRPVRRPAGRRGREAPSPRRIRGRRPPRST